MKLQERDWLMNGHKISTIPFYTDVEDELAEVKPGDRVLPAPFFYEKGLHFFLYKKHMPGEHKHFPNGGYEVRAANGSLRSYDLDQVILHPQVIKHKKTLEKMKRRAEKEIAKRERQAKKALKNKDKADKAQRSGGRKGRPALDPAEKARREAEKAARAQRSGGRRGRPKSSDTPKTPQTPKPSGGRRGRPALSPEVKAAREQARAATRERSGGRKGRPKRS